MPYLDHAASSPLRPVAREAMLAAWEAAGNPSSQHGAGRAARRVVEEARESIAADLGAAPGEVVLTSGGTESDNLAVKGLFWAARESGGPRRGIALSTIEHHAVIEAAQWLAQRHGAELRWLAVDRAGLIDLAAAEDTLARFGDDLALVSAMWANNEVGTVQPVSSLAVAASTLGAPLHTDAVQAVGAIPVDFAASGATALSLSAHKFGGPSGAGALLVRRGAALAALHHGGGHERGMRSGTLAAPLAAGMAAALREATAEMNAARARTEQLRATLVEGLAGLPGVRIEGHPTLRLPGIVNLSIADGDSEALLLVLDRAGIACSTGSACDAGVGRPSHVLQAMQISDDADPAAAPRASLRLSLGHTSTAADIAAVLGALPQAIESARAAAAPSTLAGALR